MAESITSISVAGSPTKLQSSIKNLGVYLDSKMSFDRHVSETCKASYFHIRALRHIRSSLTTEACKTVAAAIVGSRLDDCNFLLAGRSVSNLARLQIIQNTLARVVTQKSRFAALRLHWLPLRHRLNFDIAAIAFKVLHFQQPSYLAALVPRYVPTRSLRSSSSLSICVPSRKTAMSRLSHPLPQTFGISYHVIFHPSPLCLHSGRDSSITFFRVPSPVFPLHPLTSRFVMPPYPRM